MNSYATAGLGSGLLRFQKAVGAGLTEAERIKNRREVQRMAQEKSDAYIKHLQNSDAIASQNAEETARLNDLKIAGMQNALQKVRDTQIKDVVFNNLDAYRNTKDPKYLNLILKDAPEIANHLGYTSFYKLDPNNPDDKALLAKHNVTPSEYAKDPSRFVKAVGSHTPAGQFNLVDLNGLYFHTGYINRLNKQDLDNMLTQSKIDKNKSAVAKDASIIAKNNATTAKTNQQVLTDQQLQSKYPGVPLATAKKLEAQNVLSNLATDQQENANQIFSKLQNSKVPTRANLHKALTIENELARSMTSNQAKLVNDNLKKLHENDGVIRSVDRALKEANSGKPGKKLDKNAIQNIKTYVKGVLGIKGEQELKNVRFNTRAGLLLAAYIKAMSGASASDKDREFLQNIVMGGKQNDISYIKEAMTTFRNELQDRNKDIATHTQRFAPYSTYQALMGDKPNTIVGGATQQTQQTQQPQQTQQTGTVGDWLAKSNDVTVGSHSAVDLGHRKVKYSTGVIKSGGSVNWRTNNPGNLVYGPFAKKHGAIGSITASGHKFAVFPSMEAGKKAMQALLLGKYRNKSIAGMLKKYAPPSTNDTQSYINAVSKESGIPSSTVISRLSPSQFDNLVKAMVHHEGFKVGAVNKSSKPNYRSYNEVLNKYKSLIGKKSPRTGKTLKGFSKTPPYAPIWE